MILGWSHNITSIIAAVRYSISVTVRKKDESGYMENINRNPAPIQMRGNIQNMIKLIQSMPFKKTYAMGVLSFDKSEINITNEDFPNTYQQCQINALIDTVESVIYAGIPSEYCPQMLWVAHTHLQRLELHCIAPKAILTPSNDFRSFNFDPPTKSSWDLWTGLQNKINTTMGWGPRSHTSDVAFKKSIDRRIKDNTLFFQKIAPQYKLQTGSEPTNVDTTINRLARRNNNEHRRADDSFGELLNSTLGELIYGCSELNTLVSRFDFNEQRRRNMINAIHNRTNTNGYYSDF
jgi:hypothetical protein